jgi:hypothetical protein
MRTLIALFVGLALLTSACARGGYTSSSNTCEEAAQEMISTIADFVDANASVSESDVIAGGDSFIPNDLGTFDDRGNAIQAKAESLGCDFDDLETMVEDGLGVVNSDTFYGRILVEEIRADGVFGGE